MKLSKRDIGVTIGVGLACCLFLWLFWQDLNRSSVRDGGRELGTIVFRKRSATRRSPSGLSWERLHNRTPVYEGDTIRTADFSEAAILFDDGTSLDLFDNSMIKLNFLATGELGEFREGSMTLSGGSGRKITAGGRTVTFSEDARISFTREGDEIAIGVENGSATVTGNDGSSETITENNELLMNAQTGAYTVQSRPLLPRLPQQNARFVTYGAGAVPVRFAWQAAPGAASGGAVLLELARSSDFAIKETIPAGEGSGLMVNREPGTWFWRLKSGEGSDLSPVRRFSLLKEDPVKPILPADNTSYQYRRIPPSIPFSWEGSETASGYILEVAAEPEFRTPILRTRTSLLSLRVNALDEGVWYWRVLPVVAAETAGPEPESVVRQLRIVKKDEMIPLTLTTPGDGTLFQVQVFEGRGLPFSWEPHPEAVGYELAVSGRNGMENPDVVLKTDKTFLFVDRTAGRLLRKPDLWYWSVRWRDEEGNLSPWSPLRTLRGIDGSMAVKLSFPPDGYRIDSSLMSNTRFAWKSTVPARTLFQVARDSAFQNVIHSEQVQSETLLGRDWPEGEYFWRIRTFNADGTPFLETAARSFTVVGPFPGPGMITPVPLRSLIVADDTEPQILSWEKIAGADHYSIRIFAEGSETPVFQRSLVTENRLELSVKDFVNGPYRVKIQSFAVEKTLSTRIIGLIGDSGFTLRKITPVELLTPANGARFEGLAAFREGIRLEWQAKDPPESALILISASPDLSKPVFRKQGGHSGELVKRLPPGDYYWSISGTLDGYDVSARKPGRFTVLPVPPLPPPVLVLPKDKSVFGVDYLKEQRTIFFTWEPVPGATHYSLAFYKGRSREPLFVTPPLVKTEYLLEDLSVLDRGDIRWAVWAEGRDGEGFVEQPGREGTRWFTIDLPVMKQPDVKTGEVYYGR